jgi:hypothetical protein
VGLAMSQVEQLREELRRAEENVVRLRDETARIQRRSLRPTTLLNWVIGAVLLASLAGVVAYSLGQGAEDKRHEHARALAQAEHEKVLTREREPTSICKRELPKIAGDVLTCFKEVAERERNRPRPPPRVTPPGTPPCLCQPADPLCSCL